MFPSLKPNNQFQFLTKVMSMSQSLGNSKVLQTQSSQPTVLPRYLESDYHWLLEVLDVLIEFMRRAKNHSVPELTENDYDWAHAFFSIGYLLYHGNRTEKAISAYDKATALKPDFWEVSYNCGIVRSDFRQYAEAMANFNNAIELEEK